MDKFLAKSDISNQILKSAQLSSNLPVNTLIFGESGTGKKLLAKEILPSGVTFEAKDFEQLLNKKLVNSEQYPQLILYHLDDVLNIEEFLENLKHTKIVATAKHKSQRYTLHFAVKIEVPPLEQRQEDLEELISIYLEEASSIFSNEKQCNRKNIDIDLSNNGFSLKNSIYRSVLTKTIQKDQINDILEYYFSQELENDATYKELLEMFEIPLLKAAQNLFKSQVQIAKKLDINRITLRKKLDYYQGEL